MDDTSGGSGTAQGYGARTRLATSPGFKDLRPTFAVRRRTAWYQQGADVPRLLHHLGVYLGHMSLAATQVYLTMTPELLHQASTRLARYARGEDDHA
jgi:hypothetical protein